MNPQTDPLAAARRRYERLLFTYPPAWRRDHAEALLGTCLDVEAERGGTGPTTREALGMARHGLGRRLHLLTPSERTCQAAAALALAVGTALSITCFVIAEWQPGRAATGWRLEPGHVGPFPTLGPVLYAVWVAAFVAMLAGRSTAARRLLLGSVAIAIGLNGAALLNPPFLPVIGRLGPGGSGLFLGMHRPPGTVLVTLFLLALLACLGHQTWQASQRWLFGAATSGLSALLLWLGLAFTSADRTWTLDPAYAFYRSEGYRELLWHYDIYLLPLFLVLALALRRRRPQWLPAALILSLASLPHHTLPVALEILVSDLMQRAGWSQFTSAVDPAKVPITLALTVAAIWWRWRTGRPEPVGTGNHTLSPL